MEAIHEILRLWGKAVALLRYQFKPHKISRLVAFLLIGVDDFHMQHVATYSL
jgi:hypothetical protein